MTSAVDDVASYFVEHCHYVDPMKLQKLLYFGQAWHLAILDEPLLDEHFEAWRDGPVIDAVYQVAKPSKWRQLRSWRGDATALPEFSSAVLGAVVAQYGHLDAVELSTLTHGPGPWTDVRGDLPSAAPSRRRIPSKLLVNYFRNEDLLLGQTAIDIAAGGSESFDIFKTAPQGPSVSANDPKASPVIGRGQSESPRRRRPRRRSGAAALEG